MSESELEEILREVKQRANANATFNTINIKPNTEENLQEPDSSSPKQRDEHTFVISDKALSENEEELDNDTQAHSSKAEGEAEDKITSTEKEEMPKEELFDLFSVVDNSDDIAPRSAKPEKKSKKGLIILIVVILIVAALGVGAYFAFFKEEPIENQPVTNSYGNVIPQEAVNLTCNPLTGENNYSEQAVGQRPVAVVVENEYGTSAVRPQWGIADADIVLEGESEFSTRLLLFWADYNSVPEMVGPTRSARPPFIRFSQLFDSVFIHAGLSHSENNYIGADTVFETDNVDHVNLLSYQEDGVYFGRNYERDNPAVEHTGFLNGTNVAKLLQDNNFNTEIDYSKFTILSFNEEVKPVGTKTATSCSFKWSNNCPKEAVFVYDEQAHKYLTEDFDSVYGTSEVQFENLIFLLADTEYILNADYKGGQGETYCDYNMSDGGFGTILSEGSAVEIQWGVADGKLWMKDLDGNDISLNVGKSYIGYGSNNNGGKITIYSQSEYDDNIYGENYDYDNDFDFGYDG